MLGRRWKSITTVVLAVAMLVAPVQVARADSSGGFEYTITAGAATITGYTGPGGAVTIPSTLGGNPVTTIGFEAFKDQAGITSVVIPNSVTRVNGNAFESCDGLTSVVIPNSVTYFGDSAFAYCSNLASAVLSSNAKTIGQSAFNDCAKLTSVTIPYGVELIGEQCFQSCGALTSVTLPNSVWFIGYQAFAFCRNLTSANIPSSVTSLKGNVFVWCTGLTSMTVPGSVTYMEPGLFFNCTGLKSVTIGEGVTKIPCSMFENCPSLTDVSIPNSVTEVGGYAFIDCTSLKRIALPESAAIIGTPASSTDYYGGGVFRGCTSLTDVTLPSSVTNMYSTGMFKGCTSLESVILPEGTRNCNKETFAGCTSLTDVTIPDGLTSLGEDTFNGCTALKNITIPDSVQGWGAGVFQGCTSLESVVIPMGADTLRSDAFAGCTSLTSVAIPSSVTSIEYRVFEGCSKLVSAYFPGNSPTLLGNWGTVFAGCPTSFKVYFKSTATGWPTPPDQWYGYNTAYFQNTDPYLSVIGSRSVSVGSPVTFTASANDDGETETYTYTLASGAPVGAKMNPSTGVFTWTPTKAQAGRVYDIKVKVTDGRGGVDYDTPRFTVAPFVPTTIPIEGGNRYATAVAASKKAFPSGGSTYVVIATGENWPDALGGAALAGALDCPILLTKKASLPSEIRAEIVRLGADTVYILGSEDAVSRDVALAVDAIPGVGIERIAGSNRYATARLVAERTIELQGAGFDGTAFIATGLNFPDALGASPLAAAHGWPIYLSNPAQGDNATLISQMDAKGVTRALVLGGSNVVASSIETKARATLGQATRLAGDDRYKTAVAVAKYGVSVGLSWDKLAIATGTNFPDALSGGALQGKNGSVMLLTPGTKLNADVRTTLISNKASVLEVRFLGGLSAVSQSVRTDVTTSLK
jgi:putative cell wall-binding protein